MHRTVNIPRAFKALKKFIESLNVKVTYRIVGETLPREKYIGYMRRYQYSEGQGIIVDDAFFNVEQISVNPCKM